MAWQLTGRWLESCSCKMMCRCVFGPAEPDQGWCSGSFAFDIERGTSDGVDLGGTRAMLLLDFPKDFISGDGVVLEIRSLEPTETTLELILSGA